MHFDEKGELSSIPNFSQNELEVMVNDTHRLGRKVAFHAKNKEGIKGSLDAGVESIEHDQGFSDASIDQAIVLGVYWFPTLTAYEYMLNPDSDYAKRLDTCHNSLNKAYKKGMRIAQGTDAGSFPGEITQVKEFEYLVIMPVFRLWMSASLEHPKPRNYWINRINSDA